MRRLFSLLLSVTAVAALTAPVAAAEKLTVYTYESFTAEWGPGPVVKKNFEAECACEVDFVSVADGVALLNRLKLEGTSTKADIVLGLEGHVRKVGVEHRHVREIAAARPADLRPAQTALNAVHTRVVLSEVPGHGTATRAQFEDADVTWKPK